MILLLLSLELGVELSGQSAHLGVVLVRHLINLSFMGQVSIFEGFEVILLSLSLVLLEELDLILKRVVFGDELVLVLVVGLSVYVDLDAGLLNVNLELSSLFL